MNIVTKLLGKPIADKTHKRPVRLADGIRPTLGIPAILGQSDRVATGFGPYLGFVIMMTAILAAAGVSATSLIVLATGIGRLI